MHAAEWIVVVLTANHSTSNPNRWPMNSATAMRKRIAHIIDQKKKINFVVVGVSGIFYWFEDKVRTWFYGRFGTLWHDAPHSSFRFCFGLASDHIQALVILFGVRWRRSIYESSLHTQSAHTLTHFIVHAVRRQEISELMNLHSQILHKARTSKRMKLLSCELDENEKANCEEAIFHFNSSPVNFIFN